MNHLFGFQCGHFVSVNVNRLSVCLFNTILMGNYRLKATDFLLTLSVVDVQFKNQSSGLLCLELNDYSGLAST